MEREDFNLWTVFINTGGYLTLVYAINSTIHVVNYNGNFYTIKKDGDISKYTPSNVTVEEFFTNFPTEKLWHEYVNKMNFIINKWNSYKSAKNINLLLLN